MNTVSTTASASASTATASAWKVLRFPANLLSECSMKCNIITVPSPEGDFQVYVPVKISRYLYGGVATLAYIDGMEFYKRTHSRNSSVRVPISTIINAFTQYQSEGEVIRDFPRELIYNFSAQKCATCEQLVKWVEATFTGDTPLRVYELWDEKKMRYDIKKVDGVWKVYNYMGKEMGVNRLISLKGCVIDTHNDPWLLPIKISDTLKERFHLFLKKGGSEEIVDLLKGCVEEGAITEWDATCSLRRREQELLGGNE